MTDGTGHGTEEDQAAIAEREAKDKVEAAAFKQATLNQNNAGLTQEQIDQAKAQVFTNVDEGGTLPGTNTPRFEISDGAFYGALKVLANMAKERASISLLPPEDKIDILVSMATNLAIKAGENNGEQPEVVKPKGRGNSGRRKKKNEQAAAGVLEQTEQAYLLQNLDKLRPELQAPRPEQMPRLIIANTRENLLNKLTLSKKLKSLMGASPKEVSSLTPYIRIAKRDKITGQERVREFKFSSHSPDLAAYFNKGTAAGSEVGLKSFDFETTGNNFFTATRSLQGTMVLFFKSMSDLNPDGVSYDSIPWTELLFNHSFGSRLPDLPDKLVDDAPAVVPYDSIDSMLDELETQALAAGAPDRAAEIFIEIGYNFHPSDNTISQGSLLAQAIDNSKILLAIYPTTTDFNFREDGAVELTISFTGGAEHSSDNSVANVLAIGSDEFELELITATRSDLARFKKILDEAKDARQTEDIIVGHDFGPESKRTQKITRKRLVARIESIKAKISKDVENDRLSNYGKFMEYVYSRGRLYSFTVEEEEYREGIFPKRLQHAGAAVTEEHLRQIVKGAQEEDLKGKGLETRERLTGERTIAYFYLGDLINYYAWSLVPPDKRLGLKNDRTINQSREIVIGDYIFHIFPPMTGDPTDEGVMETFLNTIDTKRINLSKLPISVSMFNSFMYKRVMKHSTAVFTFDTFLKLAVPELIDNALTAYVKGRKWSSLMQSFTEAKMAISMSTVTGYAPGLTDNRGGTKAAADRLTSVRAQIEETADPIFDVLEQFTGVYQSSVIGPDFAEALGAGLNLDGIPAAEAHKYEIKSVSIDDIISGAKDPRSFTIIHGSRVPLIGTGANVEEEVGLNELADQAKWIYHLSAGLDRGIVKNISFTQQSSRLKEMNLLKALQADAYPGIGIMRMPYNAEVAIFGNPTFYPGQYVAIHPATVGVGSLASNRSIAAKLGLGGLYAIIGVKTRLSSGVLESTLSCIFNNHHGKDQSA